MDGNPADRPNPHTPLRVNASAQSGQGHSQTQSQARDQSNSQSSTARASSSSQGGRAAQEGAQGIDAGDDGSGYRSITPNELHHSPNPDEVING